MPAAPDLRSAPLRQRFVLGLSYPIRGARMLMTTPSLWPYVIVPILITATLLLGAAWASWSWGGAIAEGLYARPSGDGWLAWAGRGLWVVTKAVVHVVLFAVLAIVGWFTGGLLASPFYDRLSDAIERIVLGRGIDEPFDAKVMASDVLTGIVHSLGALALYAAASLPLWLLHLIPVAGEFAYLGLSTTLTSLFLAREVLDYSLSRRRVSFRAKLALVWDHRGVTGGMGLATFGLLWVPLLNFLSMPVAVVGGTLFFCELDAQRFIPADEASPEPPARAARPQAPTQGPSASST